MRNGAGLGLYISKIILDYFKGTIKVESRYNFGTLCNFSIPATQLAPQSADAHRNSEEYSFHSSPTGTEQVFEELSEIPEAPEVTLNRFNTEDSMIRNLIGQLDHGPSLIDLSRNR